ncbi:hypothetical protein RB195_015931 [Necator americanus]|uniref:Uncharacterized protein n=1 Tax=Necator americanus TaxID=51031 RepID=A0ABR1E6U6_NECAM
MTYGASRCVKSVFLSSQTSLVPIYRPRRLNGLVSTRADSNLRSIMKTAEPLTTTNAPHPPKCSGLFVCISEANVDEELHKCF